jgi:hypothetical protein
MLTTAALDDGRHCWRASIAFAGRQRALGRDPCAVLAVPHIHFRNFAIPIAIGAMATITATTTQNK